MSTNAPRRVALRKGLVFRAGTIFKEIFDEINGTEASGDSAAKPAEEERLEGNAESVDSTKDAHLAEALKAVSHLGASDASDLVRSSGIPDASTFKAQI